MTGSSQNITVPFTQPDYGNLECSAVEKMVQSGKLGGNGQENRKCEEILQRTIGCRRVLMTPSCTAALEIMALALDLGPGDEVIMPSFTFVSTANAVALRGAVPVFVDVDPLTFNLDPHKSEAAITPKTKAIFLVHYAGVGCDIDAFQQICQQNGLVLLEDAAQAIGAGWKGRPLGSFGAMAAVSFHQTKNLGCGEGGALLINDDEFLKRCEFIQEKGTDRSDFVKGHVGRYEWQRLGSSYLLGDLPAALLAVQLEREKELTSKRLSRWRHYHDVFFGRSGFNISHVPQEADHNGHVFSLYFDNAENQNACMQFLKRRGVEAVPHYVPLHLSPAGMRHGRTHGDLTNTLRVCESQLRLPLFSSMSDEQQGWVIASVDAFLEELATQGER